MPLPDSLSGDACTKVVARYVLPWLVWAAKHGRTVEYGELNEKVRQLEIWHKPLRDDFFGRPAGTTGDALIEIGNELGIIIPPLNALVINKATRVPSHGCDWYIAKFLKRNIDFNELSHEDKLVIVEQVHQRIFEFDKWDDVLAYFKDVLDEYPELTPFRAKSLFTSKSPDPLPAPNSKRPSKKSILSFGSGGESDNHRRMKEYVAKHPELVDLPRDAKAITEYSFFSGDRVDIMFTLGNTMIAVEIKSDLSPGEDIYRGLHQCIKYKSLLQAEQLLRSDIPNGRAFLVIAGKVPDYVAEDARRLNIPVRDGIDYE